MADSSDTSVPAPDESPAISVNIPIHDLLGLEFEPPEQGSMKAEVRMPVRPEAFGFTANLHGGAIATLVDVACALAAARSIGFNPLTQSLVTADMHVRYLGRPRTPYVIARSQVVKMGKLLIVVDCKVVDEDGHIIASADFSMMLVALREPLAPGHQSTPGAPEL